MQSQGATPVTPSPCAKRQARPRGPLPKEGSIHMWDAGRGRDAFPVHSLAVVLRGRKGSTGGESKHCCSANIAVERCCILANAIDLAEKNGRHTHTHLLASRTKKHVYTVSIQRHTVKVGIR